MSIKMETIIIESNREISLKGDLNSLSKQKVDEGYTAPTNSEWKTDIPSGIPVYVGDSIQLETASIQTLGNPDEEIEFVGKDNSTNAFDLVDNKANLEIGYYISNRRQFNCCLPLKDMVVQTGAGEEQGFGYYLPDISTFDNFKKAYPYRGIEGYSKSGTNYNLINDGVITNPPTDLKDANPIRLYLGNDSFFGFDTPGGYVVNWTERTSIVEIDVGTGFLTPSTVGEIITSQFHELDSIAPNTITQDFDTPRIYYTENNTLFSRPLGGTADKTYKSIVTSTGDIFKAYSEGQWSARLPGTGGNEGDNYVQDEGQALLYRNLLVGNPKEWTSVGELMSTRFDVFSEQNLPTDYTSKGNYTGNANYNAFGVGQYGTFHCLLDTLDIENSTDSYTYPTNRTTVSTVNNITYANIPQYQLITTNTIYNHVNVERLSRFLEANRVPTNNFVLTPKTPQSQIYQYYSTELKFGRADDGSSLGQNNTKVMVPLIPKVVQGGALAVQNSYQLANGQTRLVGFTTDGSSTKRHSIQVFTHFDKSLVDLATFPANTDFQLTNSKGLRYPTDLSEQFQTAVIPVFKKTATGTLIDVPFCAYIAFIPSSKLPYIEKGEYLGSSPSFYDNQIAKVVTTQKVDDGSKTYPTGTDPQDYLNTCYIGANNPSLKFDDTVGKFAFSDFHTAVYGSNGSFQEPLPANTPNTAVDEASMCTNSKESFLSGTQSDNNPIQYTNIAQSVKPYIFISAQSGITLKSISVNNKNTGAGKILDNQLLLEYSGTLFDKLGFELEQLLPYAGQSQLEFNRSNYNDSLGIDNTIYQKYINMVSPFTTNAYISGSNQLALSGLPNGLTAGNLGTQNDLLPVFIEADSDELIARRPATKLDYPYLTIYSDIVPNTLYYGAEGNKIPAMAYVNRSFTSGDFFFGEPTNWSYTVDKDYIISSITTKINLPSGQPAPLASNSSVIYKITRAKSLPPPPPQSSPKK